MKLVVDKQFFDRDFGFGKAPTGEVVFIHASVVRGAEVLTIGTDAWVQVVHKATLQACVTSRPSTWRRPAWEQVAHTPRPQWCTPSATPGRTPLSAHSFPTAVLSLVPWRTTTVCHASLRGSRLDRRDAELLRQSNRQGQKPRCDPSSRT